MIGAIEWLGLAVLGVIVHMEIVAWSPRLQRALLRLATKRLPADYRERYFEEWCQELDQVPAGPVTRVAFVVGLLLAAGRLRRELGAQRMRWYTPILLFLLAPTYMAFWLFKRMTRPSSARDAVVDRYERELTSLVARSFSRH